MIVESESGTYTISCDDPNHFPAVPSPPLVRTDIPARSLSKALAVVPAAAAGDDTKGNNLMGMLVEVEARVVTFVATDTHRFVRIQVPVRGESPVASFIVPKIYTGTLKSALAGVSGDAWVAFDGSFAFVGGGPVTASCRVMDARYPNYKGIIPANHKATMSISRSDLLGCLSRMAVCSGVNEDMDKPVVLSIKDGVLSIQATDTYNNRGGRETVPCEYEGLDMQVSFGIRILGDTIRAVPTEEVKIRLLGPASPVVVLPSEQDLEAEIFLLAMGIVPPKEDSSTAEPN